MESAKGTFGQRDLVEYIACALASDKKSVCVTEKQGERGLVISLKVAEDDIGKVIGKYGRIAKAMRTVLGASVSAEGQHYDLDIAD